MCHFWFDLGICLSDVALKACSPVTDDIHGLKNGAEGREPVQTFTSSPPDLCLNIKLHPVDAWRHSGDIYVSSLIAPENLLVSHWDGSFPTWPPSPPFSYKPWLILQCRCADIFRLIIGIFISLSGRPDCRHASTLSTKGLKKKKTPTEKVAHSQMLPVGKQKRVHAFSGTQRPSTPQSDNNYSMNFSILQRQTLYLRTSAKCCSASLETISRIYCTSNCRKKLNLTFVAFSWICWRVYHSPHGWKAKDVLLQVWHRLVVERCSRRNEHLRAAVDSRTLVISGRKWNPFL